MHLVMSTSCHLSTLPPSHPALVSQTLSVLYHPVWVPSEVVDCGVSVLGGMNPNSPHGICRLLLKVSLEFMFVKVDTCTESKVTGLHEGKGQFKVSQVSLWALQQVL